MCNVCPVLKREWIELKTCAMDGASNDSDHSLTWEDFFGMSRLLIILHKNILVCYITKTKWLLLYVAQLDNTNFGLYVYCDVLAKRLWETAFSLVYAWLLLFANGRAMQVYNIKLK